MDLPVKNEWLLRLYGLAWNIAIPGLSLSPRIRAGWQGRLLKKGPGEQVDLWMQASSVGEAYLALEILGELSHDRLPHVLITSGTTQGLDILQKGVEAIEERNSRFIQTAWFPFDSPGLMERALDQWKPRLLVLLETELWPGLMASCRKKGIPVAILNGRLSRKSLRFYRWMRGFWKDVRPDTILAVSPEDRGRYGTLFGHRRVGVMHNIKFDRTQLKGVPGKNPLEEMIPKNALFLVMGSVRKEEEKDVLDVLRSVARALPKTISAVFPRHIHRVPFWKRHLDRMGFPWLLRSTIAGSVPAGSVILWDGFGELSAAYGIARAAFVGGTLKPLGGQNFLEPLGRGLIPCIGPYWEHFAWVGEEIVAKGLVRQVSSRRELVEYLITGLQEPFPREKVLAMARDYVDRRRGGTKTACRTIEAYLS